MPRSERLFILTTVSPSEMESFARQCMRELSAEHQTALAPVLLVIDEWPDPRILETAGCGPDEMLLGFYEGIPLPDRSIDMSGNLPDRISLFRQPILMEATDTAPETEIPGQHATQSDAKRQNIERVIRETLLHEIAHFFGYDDDQLHELGVY